MMEFEHKVTETNEFKTLKEASKEYYSRYLEALKGKKEGMENLRSILKHEVRVLLYLSLLLTEYIKKIDNI
jgi:hypothetical protein